MHPFELIRATDVTQAIQGAAKSSTAQQGAQIRFVGGGTTLIDLMKLNVEQPQTVIDINGLPLDKVEALPDGGLKIGAVVRNSDLAYHPAVVRDYPVLSQALPFAGKMFNELALTNGRVHEKNSPPDNGIPYETVLKNANVSEATGSGKSEGTFLNPDAPRKYSTHSFGAHFVEVTWDPGIARLRVRRVVTVIDGGRIINQRSARNQIEGSIMMGIGMALFEETRYEPQTGHPINNNLADYCMAVNADTPEIDVTFLDYPDLVLNEYGARGVGEIGLAGVAAAIASAVYHASGVRIRRLPVKIEDLLALHAAT